MIYENFTLFTVQPGLLVNFLMTFDDGERRIDYDVDDSDAERYDDGEQYDEHDDEKEPDLNTVPGPHDLFHLGDVVVLFKDHHVVCLTSAWILFCHDHHPLHHFHDHHLTHHYHYNSDDFHNPP